MTTYSAQIRSAKIGSAKFSAVRYRTKVLIRMRVSGQFAATLAGWISNQAAVYKSTGESRVARG